MSWNVASGPWDPVHLIYHRKSFASTPVWMAEKKRWAHMSLIFPNVFGHTSIFVGMATSRTCTQAMLTVFEANNVKSLTVWSFVIFLVFLPCVVFVFVFLYIFVLVGSRQRQERLNFPNSFSIWTGGIYNQLNFKEASNVSEWTFDGNFRKPDILCVGSLIEKNTRFACANSITRKNSFFLKIHVN